MCSGFFDIEISYCELRGKWVLLMESDVCVISVDYMLLFRYI